MLKLGSAVILFTSFVHCYAQTKLFSSPSLGITLTYPKNWRFENKRSFSQFIFPVLDGKSQAKLIILDAEFRDESSAWQTLQADVIKTQKRQLVNQWEETLLSVPLLLTQVQYVDRGVDMTALTGLLYSFTPRKFQFRLEVPTVAFSDADTLWRSVLVSVRTTDGSDLTVERPGVPFPKRTKPSKERPTSEDVAPPEPERPPVQYVWKPQNAPKRPVVGSERAVGTFQGLSVELAFARGWTCKPDDTGFSLTHPKLSVPLHVDFHSTVTSPPASEYLADHVAAQLLEFAKVAIRQDKPGAYSAAGYRVASVARFGTLNAGGQGARFSAIGELRENYWHLSFAGEVSHWATDSKLIDELMSTLGVQVKT